MKKKMFIPVGIILILAVIGFVAYPYITASQNSQNQSSFQTEAARNGSVSVSVGATGTVRANQTAAVLWQTSGKVASVLVQKGQQIQADALLAELGRTSLSQNVIQAQSDLVNAKEALDKAINNSEARADAHLALIHAQQTLDDAEKEAQSKLYRRASQETIDIARANLINANEALDNAESVYNQTSGAGEDSPVYAAGLSQYAAARQQQQKAEYNLLYVQDLPDPLDVEESNAKLDQAKAQLLTAKQNWEQVKDGPNQDDLQAAQITVDIAQNTLDLARLSAPFAGTITQVDSKVGDLVTTGKQAFQIDDLSHLLVDVDISEVDINQVQIGQTVILTFDALPGQEFTGRVSEIASFGLSVSGSVNFTVTVDIQDPSADIKPGMTAAANVTVSQMDDVLLVPSRAVRTVDGKRVVYVLKDNTPVAVEIELGSSEDNHSQITAGDLTAGDLIIINPPASLMNFGPGAGGGPVGGGEQ